MYDQSGWDRVWGWVRSQFTLCAQELKLLYNLLPAEV